MSHPKHVQYFRIFVMLMDSKESELLTDVHPLSWRRKNMYELVTTCFYKYLVIQYIKKSDT